MEPTQYIWDSKTKKIKVKFNRLPSESVVAAINANIKYAKKIQEMKKKKKKPIFKAPVFPKVEEPPINLFSKIEKPVIGGLL